MLSRLKANEQRLRDWWANQITIYVQRINGGTLAIRSGHSRLRAALKVFGYANVIDMETGEQFRVHEVDGQIVVLAAPGAAVAETIAVAVIQHAARKSRK
jgi:hypothetical protein